jgi:putative hemolysin
MIFTVIVLPAWLPHERGTHARIKYLPVSQHHLYLYILPVRENGMEKILLAFAVIGALLFCGCASQPAPLQPVAPSACTEDLRACPDGSHVARNPMNNCEFHPCPKENAITGMPNPAAKFCEGSGYEYSLRGSEGYCIFPDKTECEEWAFYRGECTDVKSFAMVQTSSRPKTISYKFHSDGRLVLEEASVNNKSTLMAWLLPADFASFAKMLQDQGYETLNSEYSTCANDCPTDMATMKFTLQKQGSKKTILLYEPAARPGSLDKIAESFMALFETSTFVDITDSGCSLMRSNNGEYGCFGCPKPITNPACTTAPAGYAVVAQTQLSGSCTIGANGACLYVAPE